MTVFSRDPATNPTAADCAALRAAVRGVVRCDEPLAPHTSWRVGGPADLWVEPEDLDDLRDVMAALRAAGLPWMVLGKGSNVLVSDEGVRGVVISLEQGLREVGHEVDALGPGVHRLVAGGGAPITGVLHYAVRYQLQGLELWTGIPGTVGGAVVMNAGTHLGETKDALLEATVLRSDGVFDVRPVAELGMSYRHAEIRGDEIVVSAAFRVRTATDASFAQVIQDTKARRRATQPVTLPTGGSTFANPPGDSAWRLIDAAGLRGRTLGDARISELHPNFIVNGGDATAADIDGLIRLCQAEVEARFGVRLRLEVRRVGVWEDA